MMAFLLFQQFYTCFVLAISFCFVQTYAVSKYAWHEMWAVKMTYGARLMAHSPQHYGNALSIVQW